MSACGTICSLADIDFIFSSLSADDFNRGFRPFFVSSVRQDVACFIDVVGAVPELEGLCAAGAWNFSECGGWACVTGANPDGVVMWRMSGQAPYGALRFEWHPTAFTQMYRNETYGLYGIVALIALVLRLLPLGGLVLHGSAQVLDGAGIICTGPSGRGKSTISRLFDQSGVAVLTDERLIVRPHQGDPAGGFRVYGSPWPSSGGYAVSASAPLRKIYFLEQGPESVLLPVTKRDAVLWLMDVAMVPWVDKAFFDPLISTLEGLISHVPYAVLRFRPDVSAVEAVRRDLAVS